MERLPLCSSPLWTKLHPSGVLVPEEVLAPGMPGRLERELREGGVPGHGLQVSVGPRGLRKGLRGRDARDRQRELKTVLLIVSLPPQTPKSCLLPKADVGKQQMGRVPVTSTPAFSLSLVSVAPATQPALTSTHSWLLRTIQRCGRQGPRC